MFKSVNSGGTTWRAANTGLNGAFVTGITVDPNAPTHLYAATGDGVFRSDNAAGSWTATSMPSGPVQTNRVLVHPPATACSPPPPGAWWSAPTWVSAGPPARRASRPSPP
ncbi:MAG: hypothetical protein U0Y82_16985 [Thermoleophilia bacterium]